MGGIQIFLLAVVILETLATEEEVHDVDRLTYGVYFKHHRTMRITTQMFHNTFIYQLPDIDTIIRNNSYNVDPRMKQFLILGKEGIPTRCMSQPQRNTLDKQFGSDWWLSRVDHEKGHRRLNRKY